MKIKSIGGQAVIEGVMMKSPMGWSVAVRDQSGKIHVKKERLPEPPRFLKFPLIRGIAALYYALKLGMAALSFSAEKAAGPISQEGEATASGETEKAEAPAGAKPLSGFAIASTLAMAFLLGIALFLLLPLYVTKLIGLLIPAVSTNALLFNLVDGILRVIVFLVYIVVVGLWKDMRRVFEYHGAEHKAIHAYEAGKELTVAEIRPMSPLHPRCGTSFLLIVMITSMFVFSFIPQGWPLIYKFLSRLILIPAVAGISFEALKLSARPGLKDNPLMKLLVLPGLMLQRLTTREPGDAEIEVAIRALEGVTDPLSSDVIGHSAHGVGRNAPAIGANCND